jgi:hypothetical protein
MNNVERRISSRSSALHEIVCFFG